MVRPGADDDSAFLAGDGDYTVEVVSESRHQERLEWLGQGRGEEPVDYDCTALLIHEPENPRVADAVSVTINGVRVGYLPADAAASIIAVMQTRGLDRVTCDAVIEGGWYRSAEDKGDFSVRLDINPDFAPVTFPAASPPPPVTASVPSARPRNTAHDLILGAAATVAVLAFAGAVWLFVERSAESVRYERHAVAAPLQTAPSAQWRDTERDLSGMAEQPGSATPQEIGARAAAPGGAQRDVKIVAAAPARPAAISMPWEIRERHPQAGSIEIDASASSAPALRPAMVVMPVSRDIAPAAPARVPSVDSASTIQPSAAGRMERSAAAGSVAPVTEEIHPIPRRKPLVAIAARVTVEQVHPLPATAVSSSRPNHVPEPAAPAVVNPQLAPGTEWVRVIPPPRPEMEAEGATASAANEVRKARTSARSRTAPRGRGAKAKARNRPRYRNERAVRHRAAASPRPAAPDAAPPPMPPAARLFEAWTREVQAAMEGRGQQPR